ncbi:MAG: CoA-binding protein, partial [Rhodoferax sp.]
MQSPSQQKAGATAAHSVATALFQQAANARRTDLNRGELATLIEALGSRLSADPVAAGADSLGELRASLKHSREFGMVISAGFGGLDAKLDEGNFRPGRATVHALAEFSSGADFLQRFKATLAYQKLAHSAAHQHRPVPDQQLESFFEGLLQMASDAPADGSATGPALQSLELSLVLGKDLLCVLDARCSIGAAPVQRLARPIEKIDKLLHPASIGIVGVSATSMNFGRIILRNLVGSGYPKTQLTVIRPDDAEVDGIPCVANLKTLAHKLDLLIVAVGADAVPALVDEIIASGAVESVMLIPGSLGETRKSVEPAAAMAARINAAHGRPGGGPIFLGANCLGVVSHPGAYDSWFIPLERLPKPQKKPQRNSVMLSQSGAFMITRLSQNPWLDPRYMLALGNQTDLTHGD